MAERILLVNPIKRAKKKRKKARSPAQKRAALKLVAFNKAKRKPRKSTKTGNKTMAKRRTPKQKAATRKLVALNKRRAGGSIKRKRNVVSKRKKRAYAVTRTAGPARKRISIKKRRRNPIKKSLINSVVMPAATAATGAVALDLLWGYLPIPENIKAGPMRHLAKGLGAVGLAYVAEFAVKKQTAQAMGVGALSVVLHQAAKEAISKAMPEVGSRMGLYVGQDMGYYNPSLPVGGHAAPDDTMGQYVSGMSGIGGDNEASFYNT